MGVIWCIPSRQLDAELAQMGFTCVYEMGAKCAAVAATAECMQELELEVSRKILCVGQLAMRFMF